LKVSAKKKGEKLISGSSLEARFSYSDDVYFDYCVALAVVVQFIRLLY